MSLICPLCRSLIDGDGWTVHAAWHQRIEGQSPSRPASPPGKALGVVGA